MPHQQKKNAPEPGILGNTWSQPRTTTIESSPFQAVFRGLLPPGSASSAPAKVASGPDLDSRNRNALEDYQMQLTLLDHPRTNASEPTVPGTAWSASLYKAHLESDFKRFLAKKGWLEPGYVSSMCVVSSPDAKLRNNYTLRDYQMQLMLLEQQGEKRTVVARREERKRHREHRRQQTVKSKL